VTVDDDASPRHTSLNILPLLHITIRFTFPFFLMS